MNNDMPLRAAYFAPRYWGSWLLFALMATLARLSYPRAMALGRWLGRRMLLLARSRRRVAEINLQLCFPDLDLPARARLLRAHFESLGMAALETALCWWSPPQRLRALLCEIEGEAYLEQALSQGRGALVLSAHFTHLEIGSTLLGLYRPTMAVYRPHKNPLFNRVMHRARARHAHHGGAIPRDDTRGMLRALKRNLPLWYAPDQNYGGRHKVFAPFFGVTAATNAATGRLAQISGAPVVPFYQQRLPDDRGYRLVFLPPLTDFPSSDPVADTVRVNAVLETMVRVQPADYLWIHRRFRTRPAGEHNPYQVLR